MVRKQCHFHMITPHLFNQEGATPKGFGDKFKYQIPLPPLVFGNSKFLLQTIQILIDLLNVKLALCLKNP